LIEIVAVAPIPTISMKPRRMLDIGAVRPMPDKAAVLWSCPIQNRSTTLYKALTSMPIIAGIE
jgi:hypothetical protein